jgi:hypothetical protein
MRNSPFLTTLLAALGFAAAALAADRPKLIDEQLPLQEIRPLDRLSYILTLEGEWGLPDKEKLRPAAGKPYYVNVFFPDGGVYSHRILGATVLPKTAEPYLDYKERLQRGDAVADPMFLKGEVRCILHDYQLVRHHVDKGGKFTVVVSVDRPVESLDSDRIVTQPIEIKWPLDRPVQTKPARTRHAPPEAPDAFPEKP